MYIYTFEDLSSHKNCYNKYNENYINIFHYIYYCNG